MMFRNADAWKAEIKRCAKQNNVSVADMQQRYVLEEFASKIGASKHRNSFILKGGFIVSNLLGIGSRTTRDIDMTFNSTIYSEEEIRAILNDIINVPNQTFFDFEIQSIKEGQVDDGYNGFAVTLNATHDKTKLKMKLDISNNTLIYPGAIEYSFESMFTGETVGVMSYPIENIVAEKFETTLDRGEFNTRMRDLFDVALLLETQKHLIDPNLLSDCIIAVSKERHTLDNLYIFDALVSDLVSSPIFGMNFEKHKLKFYPQSELTLDAVFDSFRGVYENLKPRLPEKPKTTFAEQVESAGSRAAKARPHTTKGSSNRMLDPER